jgi:hypothetical protein
VIANDQFASPTDLEMTSTFGPWRTRAVRCTCLLLADFVVEVGDWESSVFVASF